MPDTPSDKPGRLIGEVRITAGPGAGRMFTVRDNTVLGRDEVADIVLADSSGELSRQHARLVDQAGTPVIEDLDSTNGTFVNEERIKHRALRSGDLIRVGASTLEFTAVEVAAPATRVQPSPASDVTAARSVPDATAARKVPDPDATAARKVPPQPGVTAARKVPDAGVTAARVVPPQPDVTAARNVPDVTAARKVPQPDVTAARAVPAPDVTRARERPSGPPRRWAPDLPPLDPTFAPAGAEGQLRTLSGPGVGTEGAIVGGSATIGREPECDLQVLDSEVSRRHAKVTIRDGVATIDDLSSANGTYVNSERILETYTLAPGDHIQIGEATIEITSPVFEGGHAHALAPQVSGLRDVLAQPVQLLTSETGNRKWWTLGVVCTTVFMLLLDVTIVAVALPTISHDLRPKFSSLQWIVDAYTLMLAVALLTAGSLADIFGRKRVLTIGLMIFTAASVACANAGSATFLDFARGVQGLGGATMFSCAGALIVQEFPANERAVAFGAYGAANGISVAVGPLLGGVLVQSIGWQSIFYLNVPIAAACFLVLQKKVVNLPGPPSKVDVPGFATFSVAMFLAIFATIRGNAEGWTSPLILSCFAIAAVLFVAFLLVERRREIPMLDLSLFRNRTFVGSSFSAFTVSLSVLALIFFLTTWLQSVLGYTAIQTGLRMLVFTGIGMITAPIAGRMTQTVTPRFTLTLSLTLVTIGLVSMTVVDAHSSWTAILPGLAFTGLGLGLINPTLASTAVSVVPPWRGGMASGFNSTCREAGTTVGIAVLGTLLSHQVSVHVTDRLAGSPLANITGTASEAISSGGAQDLVAGVPKDFRPGLIDTIHESYAAGLHQIFIVAAAVTAVGIVVAVSLVRRSHMIYAHGESVGH